jgi:hypothetical protein
MMKMDGSARVWATVLTCCLVVPALGVAVQDESELQRFHKRRLEQFPAAQVFLDDPVKYFTAARRWLGDRAFPIIQATRFEKRLVYSALRGAPEPRITLGEDRHVFVNAGNNGDLFELLRATCLDAHRPGSARALQKALSRAGKVGHRRELRVDVVVVPTAASLYGDKLPDSVPARYRKACLQRTAGESALLDVKAPPGVGYTYPLREMLALRSDEAFFPRGNWHPTGLSLKVARDTYLAAAGVQPPAAESLSRGEAPAELLFEYGIDQPEPVYFLLNLHVTEQPGVATELRVALAPMFNAYRLNLRAFTSADPVLGESALMLSDSFGDLASAVFASAFRRLIQINTNTLLRNRATAVIDLLQQREKIDRLIILVEEGNVGRVAALLGK